MKRIIDLCLCDTEKATKVFSDGMCHYYYDNITYKYFVHDESKKDLYEEISLISLEDVCKAYIKYQQPDIDTVSDIIPHSSEVIVRIFNKNAPECLRGRFFRIFLSSYLKIDAIDILTMNEAIDLYARNNFHNIDEWSKYFNYN